MITSTQPTNAKMVSQAGHVWDQLLTVALQRGFFGSVAVEIVVQDGTIQQLRRKVEQLDR